jgi:predicted MFS family arabinose efflux permease
MMIFAPAAGVLVFKIAGLPTVAALTAVMLLVSAAILSSLPVSPRPAAETGRASWLGDFISGFRKLTTIKSLMLLTLVSAVSLGSAGIANVATIQLVTTGLGREAYWIGLLTSVQGFGSVVTGLLAGRIIGAMGPLGAVKWGLLTFGLALGALSIPLLPVVVTAELMSGVGVTMFMVGMTVYRQLSAGSDMQGRLSSVTGMVISLAVAIGTLLGASVINVVSFTVLFAVVAVVVVACFGLLSVVPKGTSAEK